MSAQPDGVRNTANYLKYAFANLNKKAFIAKKSDDKLESVIKHYQIEFCHLIDELERGPICNSFNVSNKCQGLFKEFAKDLGI